MGLIFGGRKYLRRAGSGHSTGSTTGVNGSGSGGSSGGGGGSSGGGGAGGDY